MHVCNTGLQKYFDTGILFPRGDVTIDNREFFLLFHWPNKFVDFSDCFVELAPYGIGSSLPPTCSSAVFTARTTPRVNCYRFYTK